MRIYRYENDAGNGPYNTPVNPYMLGKGYLYTFHTSIRKHPGWRTDFPKLVDTVGYKFGFESLEKLDKWFKGWHKALRKCGYNIVEYNIPDERVVHGRSGKQVIFPAKTKRKFRYRNLKEATQKSIVLYGNNND